MNKLIESQDLKKYIFAGKNILLAFSDKIAW